MHAGQAKQDLVQRIALEVEQLVADGRLAGTLGAGSPPSKAVLGGPETVRAGLERFMAEQGPDEIIITAQIFDQAKRIRSLEIASSARDALAGSA